MTSNRTNRLHAARVSMFVIFLALIHVQYDRLKTPSNVSEQPLNPDGNEKERTPLRGMSKGETFRTSSDIVGYSGPTDLLLHFDEEERLADFTIVSSGDTRSHVDMVNSSLSFRKSLIGKSKRALSRNPSVDGVSGATLTSSAIVETIAASLGGKVQSLRFPDAPDLKLVKELFEEAHEIIEDDEIPRLSNVLNEGKSVIGTVLRTSPSADSVRGYQGPTDCLIGFDTAWNVVGIRPGQTFDNEEYVYYVRVEDYFLKLFNGLTPQELANLDLKEAEVEGVSGATYTSMAIARGLILASQDAEDDRYALIVGKKNRRTFAIHNIGTVTIALLGMIVGLTPLRGHRVVRFAFPIALIGYFGLVNGDMLSQALIVGWTRHGVPWTVAPGLLVMSAIAFLIPITTRHNVYCHHLCPHGAAQQLLRKVTKRRIKLPKSLVRILVVIPGATAATCVFISLRSRTFSIVDLEPFHAWIFQAAGLATIAIAVVGLGLSLFIPMAYCRFGCPTGFVLNFLRRSSGDSWTRTDWAVLTALVVSIVLCIPSMAMG